MTESPHDRTRRGARLVSAGILVSRVFGFARGWLFARYLGGTTVAADAYNAALKIPNVVRNLLGEGSISASFIPVYAGALARGDARGARALANAVLGLLLIVVAGVTALGIVAAPLLVTLFTPGLETERAELATRLMRVLFPMTGLMVLSGWCLGVQNAHRRFFMSYASAALWSVAQIALLAFAGPRHPDLVDLAWWVSWATLTGAVLQVASQLPQVMRLHGTIAPTLFAAVPNLRDVFRNLVPVVAATGLFQISSLVDLFIASYLPAGAITVLTNATAVYMLPLALFGVSTAAAALPELSRSKATEAMDALREGTAHAWRRVMFYVVPSSIALITIGDLIVGLLYRSGRFDAFDQRITHYVLAGFAVALIAYSSSRVLTSTYYALQDYRTPFRSALLAIVLSTAGSTAFAVPFRDHIEAAAGIALGATVGAYVNLAMLLRGLRRRFGGMDLSAVRRVTVRSAGAALIAAACSLGLHWVMRDVPFRITAVAVILVFSVVFIVCARALGLAEADEMIALVRARLHV